MKLPDYVQRRVIIEYGQRYIYATLTDANGKLLDEEVFSQPYTLDQKEAAEEARECFDAAYQHILDSVVWPSAREPGDDGKQE